MEIVRLSDWQQLETARPQLVALDGLAAVFEEAAKLEIRLLVLPFQYTKEYSSRDLATIELPLDAKTCSHILQGKIDITAQWQDDNGGAAVVYDTRRVIIQEEGPPRPAFPPTTGNSNFNFPPKPQMFSRGAEVRDATGFTFQTPRDSWPFLSFAACYDTSKNLVGGLKGIVIADKSQTSSLAMLRENKAPSLIKWENQFLHLVIMPLAFLEHHTKRVTEAFRALCLEMASIEEALGRTTMTTKGAGNDSWLQFNRLIEQLHRCNVMYHVVCDRWHFQDRLAKTLDDFLENRNVKTSRVAENKVAAVALVEQLAVLKARSASHARDVQSLPKRMKLQTNAIFNLTMQRDLQLNYDLNRINLQIAESSRQVALATQEDSASMTTIAVMTMIFLPGTFVAAFFSMTMFNWFSNGSGSGANLASGYLWIYFVVTIPLTFVVVFVWWTLRRRRQASIRAANSRSLELT